MYCSITKRCSYNQALLLLSKTAVVLYYHSVVLAITFSCGCHVLWSMVLALAISCHWVWQQAAVIVVASSSSRKRGWCHGLLVLEPWYILSTALGPAHYCTGLTTCRRYLFWCYCHQVKDSFCSSRRSSSLFMVHGQDGGQVPCSARIGLIIYSVSLVSTRLRLSPFPRYPSPQQGKSVKFGSWCMIYTDILQ